MIVLIENIEPGNYVISIFHDEDENGSITFGGFLNIVPQEGFGFSNNPSITISQPSYSDCEFNIERVSAAVEGKFIFSGCGLYILTTYDIFIR